MQFFNKLNPKINHLSEEPPFKSSFTSLRLLMTSSLTDGLITGLEMIAMRKLIRLLVKLASTRLVSSDKFSRNWL